MKTYTSPKIQIIDLEPATIIATSDGSAEDVSLPIYNNQTTTQQFRDRQRSEYENEAW
jgi:hypothetical protein